MFAISEKIFIAEQIQKILQEMNHPQLPSNRNIHFHLHINGIDSHAFCDINNVTLRSKPNPIHTFTRDLGFENPNLPIEDQL